jgi:Bacterial SH3 domain
MNSRALLWLLAFSIATPAVYGEPVYVIGQLVVSITSEPGPDAERVGQVKSGDKLELLERDGEEAQVRLPSGKEGWIKSSYLSAEPPLQQRLTERTAELDKLKQEDEKLKQDVKRLESQLAAARSGPSAGPGTATSGTASTSGTTSMTGAPFTSGRASSATGASSRGASSTPGAGSAAGVGSVAGTASAPPDVSAAAASSSQTPAAPIRETVFLRSPDRPGQTPWAFLLGISAVMLLVGFVLGWKTLDRRIRQKYGGLRIY